MSDARLVSMGDHQINVLSHSEGERHFTCLHGLVDTLEIWKRWSIVVYGNRTRSMLQTEQQFPSVNSERGVEANPDGSFDLHFGPQAPADKQSGATPSSQSATPAPLQVMWLS